MRKPQTLLIDNHEVVVAQIKEGEVLSLRGKDVRIGQVFEVSWAGEVIGTVERRMVTRERKTPGKRYVDARWESPGWVRRRSAGDRSLECYTKSAGIEDLLRAALR